MDDDAFWKIELEGYSGVETTWLVPTSEDNFCRRDGEYHSMFGLLCQSVDVIESHIDIPISQVRENGVMDIIGGELWEACFYLCAYILKNKEDFVGFNVLELGSGLGLPGLLLAKLKVLFKPPIVGVDSTECCDVCMTDIDLTLLEQLSSAMLNIGGDTIHHSDEGVRAIESEEDHRKSCSSPVVKVSVRHLDWQAYVCVEDCDWTLKSRHPERLLSQQSVDIIIGSALVYSPSHASVAFVLRHFLSGRCKEVVIIQLGQRPGFDRFLDRLTSLGIEYNVEPVDKELYDLASSFSVQPGLGTNCQIFRFPLEPIIKTNDFSQVITNYDEPGCIPSECIDDKRGPSDKEGVCEHSSSASIRFLTGGGEKNTYRDISSSPAAASCRSMLKTDPALFVVVKIFKNK